MRLVIEKNRISKSLLLATMLLMIKYEYIFVTIEILSGLPYAGNLGYGINFNAQKEIISSILFAFELIILLKLRRPSEFKENLLYIFFIMYFIPLNSVSSLVDTSYEFIIAANLFCVLFIICVSINNSADRVYVDQYETGTRTYEGLLYNRTVNIVCFIVCALFILYKISFNGFYFPINFLGGDVYTARLENIAQIRQADTGIIGLIITILADISTFIAPLYLLISLKAKKILPIAVSVLCILSQYAIYSMKTAILLSPIILLIALYKGKWKIEIKYILTIGFAVAFGGMILLWEVWSEGRVYFLLVRRMMYLPTWINTMYFDYFADHTKLYLTDEVFVIKKFLPRVYDKPILKIISEAYFSGEIVSPNNGMFSEGFMQFGYVGLVFFPFFYKVLFDWTENVYKRFGKQIQLFVCVLLIINLPNVGMLRSDFVMSFVLMTFIVKYVSRVYIKRTS